MEQGSVNPYAVAELEQREAKDRPQNVPLDIVPVAVEAFDYYPWSFAVGLQARYLSVWGFPWWTGEGVSAPVSGGFSTGFSSGFEGGADSPQGAGFDSGFSSGFGS